MADPRRRRLVTATCSRSSRRTPTRKPTSIGWKRRASNAKATNWPAVATWRPRRSATRRRCRAIHTVRMRTPPAAWPWRRWDTPRRPSLISAKRFDKARPIRKWPTRSASCWCSRARHAKPESSSNQRWPRTHQTSMSRITWRGCWSRPRTRRKRTPNTVCAWRVPWSRQRTAATPARSTRSRWRWRQMAGLRRRARRMRGRQRWRLRRAIANWLYRSLPGVAPIAPPGSKVGFGVALEPHLGASHQPTRQDEARRHEVVRVADAPVEHAFIGVAIGQVEEVAEHREFSAAPDLERLLDPGVEGRPHSRPLRTVRESRDDARGAGSGHAVRDANLRVDRLARLAHEVGRRGQAPRQLIDHLRFQHHRPIADDAAV